MKCSKCGTESMDSMAFCTVCGTVLTPDNSASVSPAPPAPVQDVAPAASPAPVSAPTAVADPVAPVYEAPQNAGFVPTQVQAPPMDTAPMQPPMGSTPMQVQPMGIDPMQGPPMGPGPMQGPPMMPPPPPVLECGQCKKPFGPEEPFCTNCGAPRQMAIVRPAKKKGLDKNTKTILMIAGAIVAVLILAFGIFAIVRESSYKNAIAQMDMGNYEIALEEFEKLGDYSESAYYVDQCEKHIKYEQAVVMMEGEQYQEAKNIFDELGDFLDSSLRGQECLNNLDYNAAIDLYNDGEYYKAYKLFDSLGSFKDSESWADKCVQPDPETGIIDKGPAYATGTSLSIKNESSLLKACFMIFTEGDEYWGNVYLESQSSTTISLASGTYYINLVFALSSAKWFGIEEMFGDSGQSIPLYINGERTFDISSSYTYEFTWGSLF